MVSSIDYTRPPMIVSPVQTMIAERDLMTHTPSEHGNDTVFLENPKEIKSHKVYEKGLFIDFYV